MSIPKVVLIGGPPFVGKSSVARCLAARYQYGCISTDDIGKALGIITTAQTHPELHMADHTNYQEYFSLTPVEILIEYIKRSHEFIWPALEKIIQTHSSWGDPLVMEGYALWPEKVMAAKFSSTGSLWLTCDDRLLEARIRSQEDFYRGATDENALITNVMKRSSRYNALMLESAEKWRANVIHVRAAHSVEDVVDLCVSVLELE